MTPSANVVENAEKRCLKRTVFVTNGSDQNSECKAYIKYGAPMRRVASAELTRADGGEQEDDLRAVVWSLAEQSVNAATFEADCKLRAPLPPLKTDDKCKYEVVKTANINDFYPQESAWSFDEQGVGGGGVHRAGQVHQSDRRESRGEQPVAAPGRRLAR